MDTQQELDMAVPKQPSNDDRSADYVVLARKYRPQNFADLIGQQALVQTLKNALDNDRLAHAFVLTGVRGVGKTTTARIIAKGLNCIGVDGDGQPTLEPCGQCKHCISITEGRHLDVMEMDAASNTGVDNVREIIDSVRYQPVSGRYKIYIIDEVHMLSKAAFNALLKTLEEPPAHVKFIFATTEINKIPITVLSRCQRFDLRRVKIDELTNFFSNILVKENATAQEEALKMIARAADGSVRDGLSILDQAISHGNGNIQTDQVRQMLGLGDSSQSLDMLDTLITGNVETCFTMLESAYILGAEPMVIIENLLTATHWLTRLKVTPNMIDAEDSPNLDFEQSKILADKISISLASSLWQILLKGLQDVKQAPNALAAAEMVCLRVMSAVQRPDPDDLIKIIEKLETGNFSVEKKNLAPNNIKEKQPQPPLQATMTPMAPSPIIEPKAPSAPTTEPNNDISSMEDLLHQLRQAGETLLASEISNDFAILTFKPKMIELKAVSANSKNDTARRLNQFLKAKTGEAWQISLMQQHTQTSSAHISYQQQQQINRKDQIELLQNSEIMEKICAAFPNATLLDVKQLRILNQPDTSEE